MRKKSIVVVSLIALSAVPVSAESRSSCEERLQAAEALTRYTTYIGMQLDQLHNGVTMSEEALKEKWLDGKKRGHGQLKEIIEDCGRQANEADNPAEAARLLAIVFKARLAEPGAADHRDIYFDAVAAISSVDRHDETDAVIPFLVVAGMEIWHEDPEEGKHLMQRAVDLAERHYGKQSPSRADILTRFAFLYSPEKVSPGEARPHADAARAEALYSEALWIYEQHPEAMAKDEYSALVGQAEAFYRLIGDGERADVLASRRSELFGAERRRDDKP